MKKNQFLSVMLSLFLLIPAAISRAQAVSSQKGLTTAVFNLQQGNIKVYLPDDIRPGDIISGRIMAEPSGKNEKQTRRNLTELKSYRINIYYNDLPVDNAGKPFQISIPAGIPKSCRVVLTDATGEKTVGVTVPSIPEKEPQPTGSGCSIPSHALAGSPLRIPGPFDGNSSNTTCLLDNRPMEVLAESPRACMVTYPSTAGGIHTLSTLESGKTACSGKISGVDLNLKAGKLNLLKGEKTYIDVQVTGLAHLPDSAHLTLTNKTPGIITMADGNYTTVSIPPPADSTRYAYTKRFTVQSIRTGTFTVNVSLDLPDTPPATTPGPVSTYTTPVTTQKAILIFGGDLSMDENGQPVYTNENELYKIYASGNSILIFSNKIFLNEFVVTNPGSGSVQDLLGKFADDKYQAPAIGCDSLTRICRKNAALNVFWGEVYSVVEGKSASRTVNGETLSKSTNSSLLITRGWEINCCTGQYQLKLFFQAMQGGYGGKERHLSFSKILRNGKPCPVVCPECKATCDESIQLLEEGRKKMEEIRKNNGGN